MPHLCRLDWIWFEENNRLISNYDREWDKRMLILNSIIRTRAFFSCTQKCEWSLHRKLQTALKLSYLGIWSLLPWHWLLSLFSSLKTIDLLSALTSNSVVIYQVFIFTAVDVHRWLIWWVVVVCVYSGHVLTKPKVKWVSFCQSEHQWNKYHHSICSPLSGLLKWTDTIESLNGWNGFTNYCTRSLIRSPSFWPLFWDSSRAYTRIALWFNFGCISKRISFPLCIQFNAFQPHSLSVFSKKYPLKVDKTLFVLCELAQYTLFHAILPVSSLNMSQCFLM